MIPGSSQVTECRSEGCPNPTNIVHCFNRALRTQLRLCLPVKMNLLYTYYLNVLKKVAIFLHQCRQQQMSHTFRHLQLLPRSSRTFVSPSFPFTPFTHHPTYTTKEMHSSMTQEHGYQNTTPAITTTSTIPLRSTYRHTARSRRCSGPGRGNHSAWRRS